jgi:hypothetical protein
MNEVISGFLTSPTGLSGMLLNSEKHSCVGRNAEIKKARTTFW